MDVQIILQQTGLVSEAHVIQPHIDYCSQLWAPEEGGELQKIEKLLKDYTAKIPEVSKMTYWERLKKLKMNSQQRRSERYKIIYVWKTLKNWSLM